MIPIIVDYRERAAKVFGLLVAEPEVNVSVRTLGCGDYLVDHRVLVERKTWSDLVKSIVDTRVFSQASRMARSPYAISLLLEGAPQRPRPGAVRLGRRQIQGALVTLSLVFGLTILRSRDTRESAWMLRTIARQSSVRIARGMSARHFTPRDDDAARIRVLDCLPGVGPRRARSLLAQFGTLEAVFAATDKELIAAKGIGRKGAARIRAFLSQGGTGGLADN